MKAKDIWDYHRATMLPLGEAKELLSAMSPDIRDRVLLAAKHKGDRRLLVDPIEMDSSFAKKFVRQQRRPITLPTWRAISVRAVAILSGPHRRRSWWSAMVLPGCHPRI